ncbi:putative transcription factor HBP-1a-like isoform 1 [Capsicum annuum]|nr:putative transcription factor HBP-1a-like isoform 1 [Capsicum annuum]
MACLLKDQHEQWKRNQDKPSRSVKVFRCQLPRYNSFYSSEPPKNNGKDKPSSAGAVLCGWCGTWRGDKVCGSCRRVHYCSEKHQAVHRKSGHKRRCLPSSISQDASEPSNNRTLRGVQEVASNGLCPEYEIAITDECEDKVSDDNGQVNLLISSSQVDESIEALMDSFGLCKAILGEDDKKSWASFQERISRTPEQVLRFYHKYSYYFGVENDAQSLDWPTIAVYTCESSCDGNVAYKEEFAWVQIASQSSTTQR